MSTGDFLVGEDGVFVVNADGTFAVDSGSCDCCGPGDPCQFCWPNVATQVVVTFSGIQLCTGPCVPPFDFSRRVSLNFSQNRAFVLPRVVPPVGVNCLFVLNEPGEFGFAGGCNAPPFTVPLVRREIRLGFTDVTSVRRLFLTYGLSSAAHPDDIEFVLFGRYEYALCSAGQPIHSTIPCAPSEPAAVGQSGVATLD